MKDMLGRNYWVVRSENINGGLAAKMMTTLLGVFSRGDRDDGTINRGASDGTGFLAELYISDSHGIYPSTDHIHACLRTVYFLEKDEQAPWYES
jgi:hypothetical protein